MEHPHREGKTRMKYTVDNWNNFCRVFELPSEYPRGFCFNGGLLTSFIMVDWFHPVPNISQYALSKEDALKKGIKGDIKIITQEDLQESLTPFLREKMYIKPNKKYLVLTDFGAAYTFTK
jgi:hypothetical protein